MEQPRTHRQYATLEDFEAAWTSVDHLERHLNDLHGQVIALPPRESWPAELTWRAGCD